MAKLMTGWDGEALRAAAGGSFERSALDAGLRVKLGDSDLVKVGLVGIEAGAPDVRVEEDESSYTVECFTDRASTWLSSLMPPAAST